MLIYNARIALLATSMLTGMATAFHTMPAAAQDPGNEDVTVLEPVTVTARKREERLKDVPISVHVESGKALEQRRAFDGQSVMREVPGASLGTFGDRSNGFVVMRGVAPILSPLSPDDSSVLTFIDGMPLPIGASFSSPFIDLERVEILKGPQNTLFGRNTSGGAINLIPAEPTHEFSGSILGEFGTDGLYRTEAMVNGSILPDVLAGRLALRRSSIDGHIDNIAGDTLGADDSWVGRGSLLFTPTDDTRWLMSFLGEDTNTTPTTYIAYRPGGEKLAAQNVTMDDTRLYAINSRFEHDFETMMLTVQTGYSRLRNSNYYNYPDANIASDFSGLPPEMFLDPTTNFIGWEKRDTRLSQEVRLSSLPGSDIAWVGGISLYRDKAERIRPVEMWYFGPSATGTSTYQQTTIGKAIFGEATFPVADRLKLTVGARATHESKDFNGEFFSDGSNGAVPYFAENGQQSYSFFTGRAALSYEWSPEMMTYASISRGYKSGGYAINNSLVWGGVARNPYESSTVISYEAGVRSSWLDEELQLNGAVFLNDMRDEQMQTWDYTNFTGSGVNLDARSAGLELDASYRLSPNWTLDGGLAYTFSELRHVSAEAAAAQDGLKDGNWLPTVPRWSGKASINYQAEGSELGLNGMLADKMFNARLSYNFIGTRYTDASNFGKLEPAHIVSARLSVDWGGGEAYLFGDNLLNREFMTIKERMGTDAAGAPVFGVSYARGMTFGAGVNLRF